MCSLTSKGIRYFEIFTTKVGTKPLLVLNVQATLSSNHSKFKCPVLILHAALQVVCIFLLVVSKFKSAVPDYVRIHASAADEN